MVEVKLKSPISYKRWKYSATFVKVCVECNAKFLTKDEKVTCCPEHNGRKHGEKSINKRENGKSYYERNKERIKAYGRMYYQKRKNKVNFGT